MSLLCHQAEAEVDSLMEQVSQAESKIRSPFKRRAGLTDEEMGTPSSLLFMQMSTSCMAELGS